MNKATAQQRRRSMEAATAFAKYGVKFVAVPYVTDEQYKSLVRRSMATLEVMVLELENRETKDVS